MKTREEDVNTTSLALPSPSDLSTMNFKDLFGPKRVCTGLKKMFTMPEKSSERKCFSVVIILSISCTPLGAVPAITNKVLSYGYSRRVILWADRDLFFARLKKEEEEEEGFNNNGVLVDLLLFLHLTTSSYHSWWCNELINSNIYCCY